jgi:hypothetical protein
MWHVWRSIETHKGVLWQNLKEENNLEGVSIDFRIILKWIYKKYKGMA